MACITASSAVVLSLRQTGAAVQNVAHVTSLCGVRQSRGAAGPYHRQQLLTPFLGVGQLPRVAATTARPRTASLRVARPGQAQAATSIQFIEGVDEQTVPEVRLTRARDGASGTAYFSFDQPSIFDSARDLGDITGLFLTDEEGTISSVEISAKFVSGKPQRLEARLVMRNPREWDRFMRFMERYSADNNLGFVKK